MTDDAATTETLGAALAVEGGNMEPTGAEASFATQVAGIAAAEGSTDDLVVPDPRASGSRAPLLGLAGLLCLGSLFGPLSASGIWEPHELKVADLARRIAVALLGASQLVIDGASNTVPTAGELGPGEIPFTSVAVGLRLFGLSEWAGRLPLALWGLVGVLATYLLLARLVDRVAGAFAAIVLATAPLYFLHARTMLGDVVTMAALAVAVAGLGIATFDERPSAASRSGYWLLGALGMAAGFGSRGVLIGVAVPALSVAVAALFRRTDRLGRVSASLCLVLGVAALALGVRAVLEVEDHQFARLLGATIERKRAVPTHEALVLELGHALFPWSAVMPFALGRLLRAPIGVADEAFERESSARILLLLVSVLTFGACTALSPVVGVLPFAGVFALAAATGLAFRDLERGVPGSRSLSIGVAALLVLFYTDFKNFPEKGLAPFVVEDAKFPESFKQPGLRILQAAALGVAGLFALFAFEREEGQKVFVREEHRRWPDALRAAYDGNVLFFAIAAEVGLIGLAAVTFVSGRFTHWPAVEAMNGPARDAARYGFVALPALLLAPHVVLVARDAGRVAVRALRATRATAAMLAIAAGGAAMSFGYYPLLARQLSPKDVFESFRRFSRSGEELAMMGTGASSGSARYYAQRDVRQFGNVQEGFAWLTEKDDARRWLVVRASDIAQMNSSFRSRRAPAQNLPVLDARSSEILLVSNQLRDGEANQNPFAKWVHAAPPAVQHKLDIDFNGQLRAIGWSVTTPDGAAQSTVRASRPYQLHLYYEVKRPISGEWQTFIHIDGHQKRYNGDHDTLEGKYPFHLWRVGDVVEDVHAFELEPNFTAGAYTVFFGLFRGDTRLEVKGGRAEDNRVNAGTLEVR